LKCDFDYDEFKRLFYPITDHLFVEAVEEVWLPYRIPRYDNKNVTVGTHLLVDGPELPVCRVPFVIQRIMSNGDVHVCCGDWNHQTVYGNVTTDDLAALWHGETINRVRADHLGKPRQEIDYLICRNCTRGGGLVVDRETKKLIPFSNGQKCANE
jgi:hypothetical protein